MQLPAVQTQKRREDVRLTMGAGCFAGDIQLDGLLHAAFVRSPHAHAEVVAIDISAAAAVEGVIAVFTGADLAAAGIKPIAGGSAHPRPDGSPAPKTDRPALAMGRVRYLGEAVAVVVAETRAAALAAAELVVVDYTVLPAVSGFDALKPGAVAVWEGAPDNIAFLWKGGNADATDAALKGAVHVTRLPLSITRVSANPIEARAILVAPTDGGGLVIHPSSQSPYAMRNALAAVGFAPDTVSVRVGDVGGSFGLKSGASAEDIVVAFAARQLQRPVLWESGRAEGFLADDQGRGLEAVGEIGFDADNRIVGLRVRINASLGAFVSGRSGWTTNNIGGLAGVYDIPAINAEVRGFLSHNAQTAAYRGAGRPEATYITERLLDVAARELGVSPFELRRINLIPPSAMPYQTALIFNYDCGEFEANMDAVIALADVAGFEARRAEAAARGKLRGLGLCNCIEVAGGPVTAIGPDVARVALMADGRIRVHTGTMSVGQGHETTFPQIAADRFGVSADRVDYVQGDTDTLPLGRGNGGSSALSIGGSAVTMATATLAERLIAIAAEQLDAPVESITLADGLFRSRDANRTMTLAEVAASVPAVSEGVAVEQETTFKPPAVTFPNGSHICEVEIDPETGAVSIVGYHAVEDIGRVLHRMLAEGQIQGGVAQGLGQGLGEQIIYDETGQLLTGSFMDYPMPRADDLPNFNLDFREVPTKSNPLGVKGVGEAGTVGSLAAVMNAVNDALSGCGVRSFDMPATPARVWEAIRAARG